MTQMKKKLLKNGRAILSQEVIERLTKAGWESSRKIALEKYQAAFEQEHLELPSKVRAFLSQFGGLIIHYKRGENREDTLDFLADEAVQGFGGDALDRKSTRLNSSHLVISY